MVPRNQLTYCSQNVDSVSIHTIYKIPGDILSSIFYATASTVLSEQTFVAISVNYLQHIVITDHKQQKTCQKI